MMTENLTDWKLFKNKLSENIEELKNKGTIEKEILDLMIHMLYNSKYKNRSNEIE